VDSRAPRHGVVAAAAGPVGRCSSAAGSQHPMRGQDRSTLSQVQLQSLAIARQQQKVINFPIPIPNSHFYFSVEFLNP